LVIHDVEESILERLRQLAAAHGRTPAVEAKVILQQALQTPPAANWEQVNAIRRELAATGQVFSDSVDLIREDRERMPSAAK
jgi:plasmid stability protein